MIKKGDWTDIGKIAKIKEIEFTEESLAVKRGEVKVGDIYKRWISVDGSETPFEPKLSTKEEYEDEKHRSEFAMAKFFEDHPRFNP